MWKRKPVPDGHYTWDEVRALPDVEIAEQDDITAAPLNTVEILSSLCAADILDPDACPGCFATTVLYERQQEASEDETDAEEYIPPPTSDVSEDIPEDQKSITAENMSLIPVAERFANQVRVLSRMVDEMLAGPPIPPREVSLEELAALVLGSERWLSTIDASKAQGFIIGEQQENIVSVVRQTVAKVKGAISAEGPA